MKHVEWSSDQLFPALPKHNDLHTNRPAAVSIYSGNINFREIKPYKPILITELFPFLITHATFFDYSKTSLFLQNSTQQPSVVTTLKYSLNAVNRLGNKNKSKCCGADYVNLIRSLT